MTESGSNIVLSEKEFEVVGTRPIRHDGADKVTGRAKYSADSHPTGYLHGKILRSPYAHARVKSIDVTKALALPGVISVVTGTDLPDVSAEIADLEEGAAVNYGFYSRNVMAREKVLYVGHAVAAVAANDPNIAEDGEKPDYGDNWKKLINDGWRLHTVKGKEIYIWEKCKRV